MGFRSIGGYIPEEICVWNLNPMETPMKDAQLVTENFRVGNRHA